MMHQLRPVPLAATRVRPGVRRWCSGVLSSLIFATLMGACGLTHLRNLDFRVDDRLSFVSPESRSLATQPVTIRWRISGFRVVPPGSQPATRDSGYFAVFVDRAPIRPGQTLKAVAGGDPSCDLDPQCPDATYLAQHQVFTTTGMQMTFPAVAVLASSQANVQLHTFTVVLMDTAGRRIGESSWELDLRIPKPETD